MGAQRDPQATARIHPSFHPLPVLSPVTQACSGTVHPDNHSQPAAPLREANLGQGEGETEGGQARDCSLEAPQPRPCGPTHRPPSSSHSSPVQQGVVQVLTETLQDLVMVPDGRGLVFTCSKVALQLKGKNTHGKLGLGEEEGYRGPGIEEAAEKRSNGTLVVTDTGTHLQLPAPQGPGTNGCIRTARGPDRHPVSALHNDSWRGSHCPCVGLRWYQARVTELHNPRGTT